ncbi:cystatin-B-like [Mustelus asterias]
MKACEWAEIRGGFVTIRGYVVTFRSYIVTKTETAAMQRQMCGGTGPEKPATQELQQLADSLKSAIEEAAKKKYEVFVVKSYKTQPVSGTNYFIKIHVGGDDYVHARVFESLPCNGSERSVAGVRVDKSQHDELAYF